MIRLRPTVRVRLTALYTGLFLIAGALLLGTSYVLLDSHLHRTLAAPVADDLLAEVRGQYAQALIAVTGLAVLLGWVAAGRVLRPLREVVLAARSVGGESLDRRIHAQGPDDELRELAETLDEMLARLETAFHSQRRFVANASHELRTPLTVMRTELEVALADPAATTEDLRRAAVVVHEELLRSQALIDSLLSLTRSEAGVVDLTERVDLAELGREAVRRLEPAAADRNLSISVKGGVCQVLGERRLLEQLVWNLVENAMIHNRPGGFAAIQVARDGDRAVLGVENSGPAVPPEAAASLLEPFQRVEQGAAGGPGAGVGLSIVRAVAQAHGGVVLVSPRAEGGLEVEVRLPAAVRSEGESRGASDRARGNRRPGPGDPHRRRPAARRGPPS